MNVTVNGTEQQATESGTETDRELRQALRDSDQLSLPESERIKRLRFAVHPTCDLCTQPIDTLADASLLTRPIGTRSTAAHCLLIHNACTAEAVRRLALHVTRAREMST